MGDSAPGFIDGLLGHIVGIGSALTSLIGKSRLSQDKDNRDRAGVADAPALRGHAELADRMRPPD